MKVLAFVDIHGEKEFFNVLRKKAEKSDLVLCGGDITVFEERINSILRKINSFNKPVLMVHGNHEAEEFLKKKCSKYKNIFFIHKEFYAKGNVLFAGYGGGGFSERDAGFEKFSKSIVKRMKARKAEKLVLLFHQPPYGKLDLVMEEHAGNKSYTDFIKKQKPALVICGHLHENEGLKANMNSSLVANPGPDGRIFEL